jgi:hypothetical protein
MLAVLAGGPRAASEARRISGALLMDVALLRSGGGGRVTLVVGPATKSPGGGSALLRRAIGSLVWERPGQHPAGNHRAKRARGESWPMRNWR